jgi:prepilin-type N-terminal cleavage/methylation domain-containing protein
MSTVQGDATRRGGFTLLEITLAVAILAMMSLAIYRFVQANITALRVSADQAAVDARYTGLLNLLTAQWQSLPTGTGALTGEPLKLNDRPRDEVTWICSAGPGLLTRYASGDYLVSLRLRPTKAGGDRMEIGFARKPNNSEGSTAAESWVPLLDNVGSLQVRYFDPRLNSWVERWTDTSTLPRLIRLVIGRPDQAAPWEAIVALGRTPL